MTLALPSQAEQKVQDLVQEFAVTWRRTLDLSVRIGEALTEVKAEQGHGHWLPWLEANFPLGERMAQNFMALAENPQRVAEMPPDTPLREAVKLLRSPRGPRPLPEPNGEVQIEPSEPLLRYMIDVPTSRVVGDILRVCFPDAQHVLDPTYGSGNFWDAASPINNVLGTDILQERSLGQPADVRALDWPDGRFDVVTFDPPHLADGGDSPLIERFGTLSPRAVYDLIRQGTLECWRVARLGIIVKVTDHVHASRFMSETLWVLDVLDFRTPYEVVHQVRGRAFIDPKWQPPQRSAYSNGSTYLVFRKGEQEHVVR